MTEKFTRSAVYGAITDARKALVARYQHALLTQMPLDPNKIPSQDDRARLSGAMSAFSAAMLDIDKLFETVQKMED